MGDNSFHTTVESLFKGMDSFITTKTVVGDAIHIGDTIILPLVDVSFGVAAGAFSQEKKNNGAGGMGGKITPSAVLVIQNGTTKLVNIKNQDGLTKVLDMVPDFVNKFTSKGEKENVVEESEDDSVAKKTAAKEMEQILSDSVNNKLAELKKLDGYARLSQELKSILLELNVADDYFKAKNQVEMVEEELAQKDQELYDLKHELISTQIKLEDAAKELEALKAQATEYQKQIVKLETELGK